MSLKICQKELSGSSMKVKFEGRDGKFQGSLKKVISKERIELGADDS